MNLLECDASFGRNVVAALQCAPTANVHPLSGTFCEAAHFNTFCKAAHFNTFCEAAYFNTFYEITN